MKKLRVIAGIACLITMGTAGCGGGDSSGTQTQNFADSVALANGQTGALVLTTQSSNSATGTLVVAGQSVSPAIRAYAQDTAALTPGAYAVSGTVTSGAASLTGTIGSTAFTLTGTIPSGTSPANITLTLGGTAYDGTITAAPTGTGADSAIAGTYLNVSISNPVSGQTATCPGTLAFEGNGATGDDNCVASELTTFSPNGSVSTTVGSQTSGIGTYKVVGNIIFFDGTETGNSEPVKRYYSFVLSGSTLTLTILSSTQADEAAQAADMEVITLSKTSS